MKFRVGTEFLTMNRSSLHIFAKLIFARKQLKSLLDWFPVQADASKIYWCSFSQRQGAFQCIDSDVSIRRRVDGWKSQLILVKC